MVQYLEITCGLTPHHPQHTQKTPSPTGVTTHKAAVAIKVGLFMQDQKYSSLLGLTAKEVICA